MDSNTSGNNPQQKLLTGAQAVDFLAEIGIQRSEHWLRRQRIKGAKGAKIPHYKVGGRIYYRLSDLRKFIDSSWVE